MNQRLPAFTVVVPANRLHGRVSIVILATDFIPLRALMPFILWNDTWQETSPMNTMFKLDSQWLSTAIQVLTEKGFTRRHDEFAARM